MRIVMNPCAVRGAYTNEERRVTSLNAAQVAREEIESWQGYAKSPVRVLGELARELGLAELWIKDESGRLDLGSFKALGGAYATGVKLSGLGASKDVTLCCATEGNHGRSVAFAAKRFGCRAVIYMSEDALLYKEVAIKALGARVVRVKGTFDDAARMAQHTAEKEGWILVADTSDPTDVTVLKVMQGYGVISVELLEQFASQPFPTHVFVQGGVGGLAAGVIGVISDALGERRPRFVVVEPENAACLLDSSTRCAPSRVEGSLQTQMRMLAVGEASPAAWPVLHRRADAFMAIEDAVAVEAVEKLNAPAGAGLNIGISGAAGLAGLLDLVRKPAMAAALGVDTQARVLVLGTEAGPPR